MRVQLTDLRSDLKSGIFCYYTGVGLEEDYAKAFECMSLSAKKGYPEAHDNLSKFYDDGIGVPKNIAKAQEHKEEYEKLKN